jgi:hypothetical protein
MTGAGYRPTVADVDDLRLPDGTPVSIRPLVAADRAWLAAAVERLSPASRYRRFMSPLRTLDETMLVRLVDQVDGRGHVALVGTLNPGSPAAPSPASCAGPTTPPPPRWRSP